MNKKKIILCALAVIFTVPFFYFLLLPGLNKFFAAPAPEKIKSAFIPPSSMPPLSIGTDKASYEYGENVKISILASDSKNLPPFESCEIAIKRTRSRDGKEIVTAGLEERYALNESSKECKEYRSKFIFSLDGSSAKSVEWDQRSCENGKVPAPAIPDDYSIIASCKIKESEGYSGPMSFSDARNIRINKNDSCKNKKIKISKAAYDRKGLLSMEIKNIGTENIENVRTYLDKCADNRKIKSEKDSGSIVAGSSVVETLITQNNCRYASLSAHIDECYDHNPESWVSSDIIAP